MVASLNLVHDDSGLCIRGWDLENHVVLVWVEMLANVGLHLSNVEPLKGPKSCVVAHLDALVEAALLFLL